jgi:O-methyltransferase
MSVMFRLGRIVNPFLKKTGFKIMTVDPVSGRTFTEGQLLKALTELSAAYNRFVFITDLPPDKESLRLLSESMFTRFGAGLYLIQYLHQSLSLNGDVCEFGVGQGVISSLFAHEIKNTDRNLWLFDSFEGFAKPSDKDVLIGDILNLGSVEAYEGKLSFPEYLVRTRLSDMHFPPERTRIVRGFIEKTIHGPDLPKTVCFAYVDFDFYEPIRTALNFLDTVLVPGGIMIVDDYGCFSEGVKIAADDFYASRKDRYTMTFPEKTSEHFCILQRKS